MAEIKKTDSIVKPAAAPEVKKPEVKAEAAKVEKKETKTVAKKAPAKKAAAPKKEAAPKAEVKTNIVLQYGDRAVSYADLVQNAKNKFQYDMGGDAEAVKKINLYVKPEENKVYFVMDNKVQGSYDL